MDTAFTIYSQQDGQQGEYTRPVDHLRPRGHPFQLYPAVTNLHKRSFIVRSFFNFT